MTGLFDFVLTANLAAVVHIKLNRVSGVLNAVDFFHLQLNVRIDHIIGKYATSSQEFTVCIQLIQCLTQAASNLRDSSGFFSR